MPTDDQDDVEETPTGMPLIVVWAVVAVVALVIGFGIYALIA